MRSSPSRRTAASASRRSSTLARGNGARPLPRRDARLRLVVSQPGRARRGGGSAERSSPPRCGSSASHPDGPVAVGKGRSSRWARRGRARAPRARWTGAAAVGERVRARRAARPALEASLRGLARCAGLCVITTRKPLADLAGLQGTGRGPRTDQPQAGRALLRTRGSSAQMRSWKRWRGGSVPMRSQCRCSAFICANTRPQHWPGPGVERLPGARPIDRVLAGFEQWLGKSPAREALRLLGLFDRPADRRLPARAANPTPYPRPHRSSRRAGRS